ncbi:MAG: hypothetical protein ACK6CT_05690 [Planctomycetia bacterium]|jgi:hypothetical protein
MRILLVDHGRCDDPASRSHVLRAGLEAIGMEVAVCGPSRLPGLEGRSPGMYGIHLHDVAAGSRLFLAAVRDGSAEALLGAVADVKSRLLGLARETARQAIDEAADALYPDAIFVAHASILTDLAAETGAPVVVHVAAGDLTATAGRPSLRRLVGRAIGSSTVVVAADDDTAATLRRDWMEDAVDAGRRLQVWPLGADAAPRIAAACGLAVAYRRGGA